MGTFALVLGNADSSNMTNVGQTAAFLSKIYFDKSNFSFDSYITVGLAVIQTSSKNKLQIILI